jgi:hypothetical protein
MSRLINAFCCRVEPGEIISDCQCCRTLRRSMCIATCHLAVNPRFAKIEIPYNVRKFCSPEIVANCHTYRGHSIHAKRIVAVLKRRFNPLTFLDNVSGGQAVRNPGNPRKRPTSTSTRMASMQSKEHVQILAIRSSKSPIAWKPAPERRRKKKP